MAETYSKSTTSRPLSELIAHRTHWPLVDRLELARRIVLQLQSLHHGGRTHRAIGLEAVRVDAEDHVQLDPPCESRRFGGDQVDPEFCPPELAESAPIDLPAPIQEAAATLQQAGLQLDPRRFDFHQLGALLCHLLIAEPVRAYLFDPEVKSDTPAAVRPLLAALLGDDEEPLVDADRVLAAIDDAIERAAETVAPNSTRETPPGGSMISKVGDTPREGQPAVGPGAAAGKKATGKPGEKPLPFEQLGHFKILQRIGHGGMGDVYLGWEESLNRHVAIKVLPPELARDEDYVRRFHTEATSAAKLNHLNVVQVYFSGEDQGRHFFAMQYIEGEPLAERLTREGRLPLDETLGLLEKCLAGLEAAHKHGLIHRDIKPGNILIEARSGRTVLVDFGLVRTMGAASRMTATGVIMGTVDYIAPEQARGQPVDGRADVYSLGVLAYQVLSGRLPFRAESPTAMIFQHAFEAPVPLSDVAPDVPELVVRIVERMMEKRPDDRYQSAAEVQADILAFREGRPLAEPKGQRGLAERSRTRQSLEPKSADFDSGEADADEPFDLPADLDPLAADGGWQRARDWAATMFRRHAPEAVQRLQGTTLQVDGAVAQYERRQRRLAGLLAEARGLAEDLARQLEDNRQAAATADSSESSDDDQREQAETTPARAETEANITALERQLEEQQQQVDELEHQLGKTDARLAQLKSQRDLLLARLKSAETQQKLESERPRRRLSRPAAALIVLAVLAVLGPLTFALVYPRHRTPNVELSPTPFSGREVAEAVGDQGAVAGRVFGDSNSDLVPSPGETGHAGWTVELTSLGRPIRTFPSPTPSSVGSYGLSIAVVGDNLLVGDPDDDTDAADSGMAYLVDGTTGEVQLTLLNPTPENGDKFGWMVAAAGSNLLITSLRENTGGTENAGAVYLFDGETGDLLHTFSNPSPDYDDNFGRTLAGSTKYLVIGAPKDDAGAYNCGAVYVFDAATYELQQVFSDPNADEFAWHGAMVALVGDTLIVGAHLDDSDVHDAGMVYIYDVGTGKLLHRIHNPEPHDGDVFGEFLTTVGDKLAVRRLKPRAGGRTAVVDIFDLESRQLLHTMENPNPDGGPKFGRALAPAGSNLLVGAPAENVVYLFDPSTGELLNTYEGKLASDFGRSVAGRDDQVWIGAPSQMVDGIGAGVIHLCQALPTAKTARTGRDGSYRFDKLPPGTYRLRTTPPSGSGPAASTTYEQTIEIKENETITADLPASFNP